MESGWKSSLQGWYLVGGAQKGHGLGRLLGQRLAAVWAVALMSLVPLAALAYECSGWTPLRLWDGSFSVPRERQGYLVYNNTGTVVFVYHPETRSRYTFAPGQSGHLGQDGMVLKFHPSEIICGSLDCRRQCTVRLALIDLVPVVVLELAHRRPAPRYVRRQAPSSQPPERRQIRKKTSARVRPVPDQVRADPCAVVRVYLEKMVHIYCRYQGVELGRRLNDLKYRYANRLRRMVPQDIFADVGRYESICQCVNKLAASGMDTKKIFTERRCGDFTTKQLRARIIDRLRTRIK